MVRIYCMKCRDRKDTPGATSVTLKNGKAALKGVCPDCGTNVFRLGQIKDGESLD